MFKPIPNTKLQISTTAGEVPSVSDVAEKGAHINSADLKIYYIQVADTLITETVTLDTIATLAGVEESVRGTLTYTPAYPITGTYVTIDDISDIVTTGDRVQLPYGQFAIVLAVINQDRILVDTALPKKTFPVAGVSRDAAPLIKLTNPSPLSIMWDEIVQSTIPQPPGAYSNVLGHWRFMSEESPTEDLLSSQALTIAGETPTFTDPGYTIDVDNPYMELPYTEGVDPTETISMVVRNRGTDVGVLFGTLHSSGDGIGYGLYVNEPGADGTASLSINNRGGYRAGDLYLLPLNVWVHLSLSRTITATSEVFALYANGVKVWEKEELVDVGNYATSNKAYCIGDAYYGRESTVDFDVLDVAFFDSALDDTGQTELYASVKEGMAFYGITLP